MPITASPWNDAQAGYGWEVTRGSEGLRGVRHYLVNTEDEGAAAFASGLPNQGEAWGTGGLAGLKARNFLARYLGGKAGQGGVCVVSVQYAEENSQFSGPEPAPLKKWLSIEAGEAQVTLLQDVRWSPGSGAFAEPLLNGDGFARDTGVDIYTVHKFMPLAHITDGLLSTLAMLNRMRAVNQSPVVFPPVLGGTVSYTRGPGQCRFLGYTLPDQPARDDLYHLTVRVHVAEDHLLLWTKTDEYGRPYQSFESQVYETVEWGTIW